MDRCVQNPNWASIRIPTFLRCLVVQLASAETPVERGWLDLAGDVLEIRKRQEVLGQQPLHRRRGRG